MLGCDGNVLRAIRDPAQVAACLRDAGLSFAPLHTASESIGGSADDLSFRESQWLLKPLASCAGHGIVKQAKREVPANSYLQKLVAGELQSGSFIANGSSAVWLGACRGFTVNEITPPHPAAVVSPFGYAGSAGPRQIDDATRKQWQAIGDALAKTFRLKGLFGVDVIATPKGDVVPIEVNPRYNASMELLERANEQVQPSLIGWQRRVFLDSELPTSQWLAAHSRKLTIRDSDAPTLVKQIIYARESLSFSESSFRDFQRHWQKAYPEIVFCDLPDFNSTKTSHSFDLGQPIMTVVHRGHSLLDEPAALQNGAKDSILS